MYLLFLQYRNISIKMIELARKLGESLSSRLHMDEGKVTVASKHMDIVVFKGMEGKFGGQKVTAGGASFLIPDLFNLLLLNGSFSVQVGFMSSCHTGVYDVNRFLHDVGLRAWCDYYHDLHPCISTTNFGFHSGLEMKKIQAFLLYSCKKINYYSWLSARYHSPLYRNENQPCIYR